MESLSSVTMRTMYSAIRLAFPELTEARAREMVKLIAYFEQGLMEKLDRYHRMLPEQYQRIELESAAYAGGMAREVWDIRRASK